ncbi:MULTISPECIES: acyl carrier protein [Streptomycetaceae]|uniref:Acyl carrier protein n=3 Tax=Streptomyces rochei group TaxID=2867164 RepID=A0AAX3ZSN5_STRRO|nr:MULTISPECIES: acyl carrier protein [Streptomyces]MDV6287603.1 acyl carrier protein [Streptomyces sp. UP1A-1]RIH59143.1 acyl carrier protein [Streptomyces sp. SHP22-7]WDI22124.1 acyl carrier protein [Streptomyces enissocaesilis]KYK15261.1 phosphopantetheine-binding protein [Streptomyces sp. CC71]MBJ6622754.1 acyl carrier protein [Streptomyces sp. DHE17-7]
MWDEKFEAIVRRHLPFLGHDEELTPDTALRDLGLDSLATVELLSDLESAYGLRFVDEALTLATFATPERLWLTLHELDASAA